MSRMGSNLPELRERYQHDLSHQCTRFLQRVLLLQAVCSGGLSQREGAANERPQSTFGQPAVDVRGTQLLLVCRGVEHREAKQTEILRIERSHWKDRLRLPAGHDNHAPTAAH